MTEDEAKTKMCCGPQIIGTTILLTAPTGRVEILPEAGKCIASACMAWRWAHKPNPDYKPHMAQSWPGQWPPTPMQITDTERGGCGIAGAPQ